MLATELDASGSYVRAGQTTNRTKHTRAQRDSTTSSASSSDEADEDSYITAANSLKRSSAGSGGLGISAGNHSSSNRGNKQRMGSTSTITAAADAQRARAGQDWPEGIMRQTDVRVESHDMDLAGLDAKLRRRSTRVPRDGRLALQGEREALGELTTFLRNVTPPPTNFMSVPDPISPATLSSIGSLRRRKRRGPLKRALGLLLRRGSNKKNKTPSKRRGSASQRVSSPPLSRTVSVRKKRPPRIKLPDTAVAGTTVDGYRHIAISIPIEHAHLGPERRQRFPSWDRRSRSVSSPEISPKVYHDIQVRPMTAFVSTDLHRGTQLGPLVEERESLSSTSWEKSSSHGTQQDELSAARKARLASRHTFGTVHEEVSRPNTSSGHATSPPMPARTSSESGGSHTPRTSEETRDKAHRQTLTALVTGTPGPPSRPTSGAGPRPVSAYSFRSFTSGSPSRVYYPKRNSSLHPSEMGSRRPRTMSGSLQQHSRDSSRDHTLQESIFSNRSYLESIDTMESAERPPAAAAGRSLESRGSGRGEGNSGVASVRVTEREIKPSTAASRRETTVVVVQAPSGERDEVQADLSAVAIPERHSRFVEDIPEDPLLIEKSRKEEEKDGDEQALVLSTEQGPGLKDQQHEAPMEADAGRNDPDSELQAEAAATKMQEMENDKLSQLQRDDMLVRDKLSVEIPPDTSSYSSSRPQTPPPNRKGKQRETSPSRSLSRSHSRRRSLEIREGKPPSPLPSPKERRDKRKSTLLTRKQRIAQLRMALEKPGSQPSDLVWNRRLSTSSDDSTESMTPRASRVDHEQATFRYPPGPAALTPTKAKSMPNVLSLTKIQTVVEVQPSSPGPVSLERKDSIPLSVSSPATIATIIKTSPVPPYQGVGSVTPPDSPPNSAGSPTSQYSPPEPDNYPLRRRPSLPLKRANSRRSIRGLRTASNGQQPPIATKEELPRPKTAGKGSLASKKDFFGALSQSSRPDVGEGSKDAGAAAGPAEKSVLKMSRSEIFDRYEALREKQTRDMERRIRRLERNGDYWLTSMLPLLTDMHHTLGALALGEAEEKGKGKGKEVDRGDRRGGSSRAHVDGRQSRFAMRHIDEGSSMVGNFDRDEFTLDRDEAIIRHHQTPIQTRGPAPRRPKRLYLQDEHVVHPELGYRVNAPSFTHDGRSLSLNAPERHDGRPHHRRSRAPPSRDFGGPLPRAAEHETSASTTLVDTARANSLAKPPTSPGDAERLARIERLNERVAAQMRHLSFGISPPPDIQRRSPAPRPTGPARRSHESLSSLETYDDTDASFDRHAQVRKYRGRRERDDERMYRSSGSGMERIEPLMRELQVSGSRLSMETVDSGEIGDDEVRRMRRGPEPRSVVGFGAFSL